MSLFGTYGIRGLANGQVLTAELALDVAVAAAHILTESFDDKSQRPSAIVGQDSRASGEFLESAVVAGLTSAGVDVYRVGVLPTPAISYLVANTGADLGVMISASHNAMPDNGIKLFARGGGKLDDSIEALVEAISCCNQSAAPVPRRRCCHPSARRRLRRSDPLGPLQRHLAQDLQSK